MKKKSIIILLAGITLTVGLGAAIPYFFSSADQPSGKEDPVAFASETTDFDDSLTNASEGTDISFAPDEETASGSYNLSEGPNLVLDEKTWFTPEECEQADYDEAYRIASEKKPEEYSTEALRTLAQKYIDEGHTIYDLEYVAFHASVRFCCGDYAFINGFMVDEEDYNEVIACASAEEFNALLDYRYDIGDIFQLTSTEGTVKTYEATDDINDYTLIYDSETEIFIFKTYYRVPITGGVG